MLSPATCSDKVEERKWVARMTRDKMKSDAGGGRAQRPYKHWLQPETFNLDLI